MMSSLSKKIKNNKKPNPLWLKSVSNVSLCRPRVTVGTHSRQRHMVLIELQLLLSQFMKSLAEAETIEVCCKLFI